MEVIDKGFSKRIKDLKGMKFGRLEVIDFVGVEKNTHKTVWRCVCDCGVSKGVMGTKLTLGEVQSCGCLSKESIRKVNEDNPAHKYKEIEDEYKNRLYKKRYIYEKINKNSKKIFCILGFSSSGKDTISKIISNDTGIPILTSHTTRPPRNQKEIDEKAYYFVDDNFFDDKSKFVEMRKYNTKAGTWKYGLTFEELAKNQLSIFIVDRQGMEELIEVVGDESVVSIFIQVDEETLRVRQKSRGDSIAEFERRLEDDKKRFEGFMSDYVVNNYDLELAVQQVKQIIVEELGE